MALAMVISLFCSIGIFLHLLGVDLIFKFEKEVVLACFLLPLVGLTFGYIVASVFRQDGVIRRTTAIETGCQNVQLCAVVLQKGFAWCDIGIYFSLPLRISRVDPFKKSKNRRNP